ncbi:MAG: pantothenate kinase [Elusimicrobia bacterium]|nr:MAG: pantothenate kinase [Elusimicrobiota bacterium]
MGSILAVDIGNTNLTFGLFRGERVAKRSRLATAPLPSGEALRAALKPYKNADRIIFASVVPKLDARFRRAAKSFAARPLQLTPRSKLGIRLRVETPHSVGADRIANALAAHRKSKGAAIVIDFGTATTFDCVARNGDYLGGAILPGPQVASQALALKAAKLPEVPIRPTRRVIGKNTVECLQSGIYYGYLGMIDRVLDETVSELGKKNKPKIIVTGGLGRLFLKAMKRRALYLPDLTLAGIRMAADIIC